MELPAIHPDLDPEEKQTNQTQQTKQAKEKDFCSIPLCPPDVPSRSQRMRFFILIVDIYIWGLLKAY